MSILNSNNLKKVVSKKKKNVLILTCLSQDMNQCKAKKLLFPIVIDGIIIMYKLNIFMIIIF